MLPAKTCTLCLQKQNEINRVIISFEENQSRPPLLDELDEQIEFTDDEMLALDFKDDRDKSEFLLQILTQYETNKNVSNVDIEMGSGEKEEVQINVE